MNKLLSNIGHDLWNLIKIPFLVVLFIYLALGVLSLIAVAVYIYSTDLSYMSAHQTENALVFLGIFTPAYIFYVKVIISYLEQKSK